jgi:hypothetical protein
MALKNALLEIWPGVQQQLCIFHINKNMALNIKRKCKDNNPTNDDDEAVEPPLRPLDDLEADSDVDDISDQAEEEEDVRDLNRPAIEGATDYPLPGLLPDTPFGIYSLWLVMVYTAKEVDFNRAWARMQNDLDQPSLVAYIKRHLIPFKTEWACCFINQYTNFGQRTTSPTEASHRNLKAYLLKGTSTLFRLAEVIQTMLLNAQTIYEREVDRQKTRLRSAYLSQTWLGHANRNISYKGVDMLAKQRRIAMSYLLVPAFRAPTPQLQPCTSRLRVQYGIPCSHDLLARLQSDHADLVVVDKSDWHQFWWLERPLDEEDPYVDIEEPLEVTTSKGRPSGGTAFVNHNHRLQPSVRRRPSTWEVDDVTPVERPTPSTAPAAISTAKRRQPTTITGGRKRPRLSTTEVVCNDGTQSQIVVAIGMDPEDAFDQYTQWTQEEDS